MLKDGTDYSGNFQIYHLNSGNLIGSLWLTRIDSKLNNVINFNETFRFVGQTKSGLKISAERCAIYSTNFQGSDNFPFPLITTRFLIRILNVYNADNLENLREGGTTLYVEVGILNYYSRIKLRLNTEIGEVQFSNRLSDDQITIFQNAHIPDITASLHPPGNGNRNCDPSYPTVCIKSPPPDLNCGEISHKNFKVTGGDPHGFDRDNDGIGCESENAPPIPPPNLPICDENTPPETPCIDEGDPDDPPICTPDGPPCPEGVEAGWCADEDERGDFDCGDPDMENDPRCENGEPVNGSEEEGEEEEGSQPEGSEGSTGEGETGAESPA